MTFDKGSLVLVDYTAKVKDSEKVFDTTIEEDAIKNLIYEENVKYQPKLVSIGEISYPVLQGLDEALAKTAVGDKLTVEVTPDKGFGTRDSRKIRMISIRKLGEDAEKVSVGDTIEVDNKKGIIRFIGSGRVQVDYNHKHAGKTILFDVNVIKSLDSPNDKVDGILKNRFPVEDSKISFDLKDKEVSILVHEEILRAPNLQTMKHFIQLDIFKFVPTIEKVSFVETYISKQAQETKYKTAENPTAEEEKTAENPTAEEEKTAENPTAEEEKTAENPTAEEEKTAENPTAEEEKTAENPTAEEEKTAENPTAEEEKTAENPTAEEEKTAENPTAEEEKTAENPTAEEEKTAENPTAEEEKTAENPTAEEEKTAENPTAEEEKTA